MAAETASEGLRFLFVVGEINKKSMEMITSQNCLYESVYDNVAILKHCSADHIRRALLFDAFGADIGFIITEYLFEDDTAALSALRATKSKDANNRVSHTPMTVHCGNGFHIVSSKEHDIAFGRNESGQCGKNHIVNWESYLECTVIEYFGIGNVFGKYDNIAVKKICTKPWGDHTFWITSQNTVYAAGSNPNAVLGLPFANVSSMTRVLSNQPDIVDVQQGEGHSIALDVDGNVFAAGNRTHSQCGYGWDIIFALRHVTIRQISVGAEHSIFLDKKGRVFVWGNN